jgi:YidC/Oxa1 family membrane protein insertase
MNNDSTRLIVFVLIAGAILFGSNYFFGPKPNPQGLAPAAAAQNAAKARSAGSAAPAPDGTVQMKHSTVRSVEEKLYTMENSLAVISFSNIGGSLSGFKLKKYNDMKNGKDKPLEMLPARSVATYLSLYSSELNLTDSSWTNDGVSSLNGAKTISFSKQVKPGIKIIKEFSVPDDSYTVNVKLKFVNKSQAPYAFKDLQYSWGPNVHYLPGELTLVKSGTGGGYNKVVYTYDKTYKVITTNLKSKENKITALDAIPDWIAVKDLYFASALKPVLKADIKSAVIKDEAGGFVYLGMNLRDILVNAGSEETIAIDSYIGPAEYYRLKKLGMDKIVDLGGIRFLGEWMFYGLDFIYKLTKNYGVAILLLTLIIRLLLWIPSNSSFKQMKETQSKMAVIKPRMETLKKIYKDDAQKLNEETMKLYQEYKINPFGGCLPMLLQLPVFIALYGTLINVVELKGANFGFWIKDLSKPDPFYILPVFMGLTMLLQQKMSAQPSMNTENDSTQKIMMYGMPIFLTYMAFQWPAGLMLYWSISNLLGIAQQLLVNKSKK